MSRCAACGIPVTGRRELCAFHESALGRDWAAENRILYDFLHRGVVPRRLPAAERDSGSRISAAEVAECRPNQHERRRWQ